MSDLTDETRAGFIYLDGGDFTAGNYEVQVATEDGEVETRWVAINTEARAPQAVTLAPFYLAQHQVTNAEFAAFLRDTDGPALPDAPGDFNWNAADVAVQVPYHMAQAYCEWLGEQLELPVALPTEDQWEYAARSGAGFTPPWPTNDGTWRKRVNVWQPPEDAGFVSDRPEVDAMPPNPAGFYGMADTPAEWVLTDPQDETRIAKGGSGFRATIPSRARITPTTREALATALGEDARDLTFFEAGRETAYIGVVGLRCAVNLAEPPDQSGVGRVTAEVTPTFPAVNGPYDSNNELIEN